MLRPKYFSKDAIKRLIEIYEPFLDFFDESVFLTNSSWNGEDFLNHIKTAISNAIHHCEKYIANKENDAIVIQLKFIIKYYQQFPKIIELAMIGKRSAAFDLTVKNVLQKTGMAFKTFNQLTHYEIKPSETNVAYRVRHNSDSFNTSYSRKDLFHVPFEKSHLIGNNRFSLSGLPCLYLGNNVLTCWEELGRPKIEECHISKFDFTEHSFIDLSRTPNELSISLKYYFEKLKGLDETFYEPEARSFEYLFTDYLRIWPIIFCCSIRTYYPNSVYKPEYIFPQLMLEWIMTDDLFGNYDGIIYNSTKASIFANNLYTSKDKLIRLKNYVIPTRKLSAKGICHENKNKLKLTKPFNLQIENLTNPLQYENKSQNNINKIYYENSVFGKIEERIESLKLEYCS